MRRNVKYIALGICIIIAVTITLYFYLKPAQITNDEEKSRILKTFEEKKDTFLNVVNFLKEKDVDIHIQIQSSKKIIVTSIDNKNVYLKLKLKDYREINSDVMEILFKLNFSSIKKKNNEVVFNAGTREGGIQQGIFYSLAGTKPEHDITEYLENNWYYYLDTLE